MRFTRRILPLVTAAALAVTPLTPVVPQAAVAVAADAPPVRIERREFPSRLLPHAGRVDVIVPADYSPDDPPRPVVYLLYGGVGEQPAEGPGFAHLFAEHAGQALAREGFIGVVPHFGAPFVDPKEGAEDTATIKPYHSHVVREVLPFVERNYRVIADRNGRAAFGHSTGAYSALLFGLLRPDLFSFIGASSGAIDNRHPSCAFGGCLAIATLAGSRDAYSDEIYWRGHSPKDLATNLLGAPTTLAISVGDGECGAEPGADCNPADIALERAMRIPTDDYSAFLKATGVEHTYFHVPGTHAYPYHLGPVWGERFLPLVAAHVARDRALPEEVRYRTTRRVFDVYGYRFAVDRPNTEFLDLEAMSRDGFVARGTGALSVTTPPHYRPGGRFRVVRTPADEQPQRQTVRADRWGRLRFTVELGTTRTVDQHSALEAAGQFPFQDFRIRIRRL